MENFLNDAFDTYTQATAKSPNVWVTVYPDPGGKDSLLYAGEGEPGEQWHFIENTINKNLKFFKRFSIRVARPIKEGASAKNAQAVLIKVVYEPLQAQPQVAGIGALPGVYGYGQPADIGAIKRELKEEFAEQMKREKELWDMQSQIAGLSYELQQKKKKSGDVMDKIEGIVQTTGLDLSNPQSIQAVSGLVMGALDKILGVFSRTPQPIPTPALAGRPRPGTTHVHHQEATTEVPTDAEPEEDEAGAPLTDEDYEALDALDILKEAGAAEPGKLLKRIAKFYSNDPEQAKGFLNFLPA